MAATLFVTSRGVAQSGSALGWGPSGRWFESSRPDNARARSGSGFRPVGPPPKVAVTGPWYPLWYRTIIGWVSVAAVQFIRAVRIKDFRSLPSAELSDVDNIVPIAGPNGSGKSNLLRALNLFFNGEVEDGVPLDLGRDYHDPEQQKRRPRS